MHRPAILCVVTRNANARRSSFEVSCGLFACKLITVFYKGIMPSEVGFDLETFSMESYTKVE